MSKTIAVIASLDTKGLEIESARQRILELGHKVLIIDTSLRYPPMIRPDISSEAVIKSSGLNWEEFLQSEKNQRIEMMKTATASQLKSLYDKGLVDAVFSMGGAQNTIMATAAMKVLPLGVPKVMLTTMASGRRFFEPITGTKDIVVMHSVADISGINFITENVIANAVAAIVGMAESGPGPICKRGNKVIGATMLGITSQGVVRAAQILQEHGYEVVTFHANGVGGRSLEELIEQGMVNAVLDMTLHEITSELLGGFCAGTDGRLLAAAKAGIPQVLVPGAVDMIDFSTDLDGQLPESVMRRAQMYYHNNFIIHTKLTLEEIVKVAEVIAERVNTSKGPVTFLLPLRGFCEAGAPGGQLFNPAIDQAFIEVLRKKLVKRINLIEVDHNINDPDFAITAAQNLLSFFQ